LELANAEGKMSTKTRGLVAALVWSGLVLALVLLLHTEVAHAADQVVVNTNDDGPGSLRQAIRDVNEGGMITFNLGAGPSTITLSTGELEIVKSLTIAGPGADLLSVSGADASRVFSIISGDVTISSLTIAHGRVAGHSPEGGAVRNAGHLVLQQVTIQSSRVESTGGAGFEDALGGGLYNKGVCRLDHCTVESNTAQGGPMTGNYGGDGSGGGIYNEGVMTVTASSLHDNLAKGGTTSLRYGGKGLGGGLSNAVTGTLTISASTIFENHAVGGTAASDRYGGWGQGGGVHNQGQAAVQDSNIMANTALGGVAYRYGGDGSGGGIYSSGSLSVFGGSVQANLAKGAAATLEFCGSAEGGGIASRGSLTVTHGAITGNTAQGATGPVAGNGTAGGVYGIGQMHIEDSSVCDNKAMGGTGTSWTYGKPPGDADAGGLYSYATGDAGHTILRTDVCNNLALGGQGDSSGDATAGGIYEYTRLIIDQSTIYGNIARGGPSPANGSGGNGSGGGAYGLGELTVKDSAVYSNTAQGGAGMGGYSYGGTGRGGGIYQGSKGNFTVWGSAVYSNTAQGGNSVDSTGGDGLGGGYADSFSSYTPTAAFLNATFQGNRALRGTGKTTSGKGVGGGLAAGGATAGLSFCTVAGNTADDQGGGLLSRISDNDQGPAIKNTILADNAAPAGPDIFANVQSRGYNLVRDASGGTLDTEGGANTAEGNLIGVEPGLGPFQDNGGPTWTRALADENDPSPAMNAGSNTDIEGTLVPVDQRGYPRPFPPGGKHDIGAFEWQSKVYWGYLPLALRNTP
jgi:hypothetical protein